VVNDGLNLEMRLHRSEEASMTYAILANHNTDKKPNTEARKAGNNEETTEGRVGIGPANPRVFKHKLRLWA